MSLHRGCGGCLLLFCCLSLGLCLGLGLRAVCDCCDWGKAVRAGAVSVLDFVAQVQGSLEGKKSVELLRFLLFRSVSFFRKVGHCLLQLG